MELGRAMRVRYGAWESQSGDEVRVDCPRCGDEKQHLYLNLRKRAFICFRCGWGGRADRLLEELAKLRGGPVLDIGVLVAEGKPSKKPIDPRPLPPDAYPLWVDKPSARVPRRYVVGRGVPETEIEDWQVYYAISGPMASRVILPVVENGEIVNWTARSYIGAEPRYLNPLKGESIADRNECVFGLDHIAKFSPRIVILEGPLNAMVFGADAVAMLGKNWSSVQLDKLLSKDAGLYMIGMDRDAIGTFGTLRGDMLPGAGLKLATALSGRGKRVAMVPWPHSPKQDACDLGRAASRHFVDTEAMPWSIATEAYLRASFFQPPQPPSDRGWKKPL